MIDQFRSQIAVVLASLIAICSGVLARAEDAGKPAHGLQFILRTVQPDTDPETLDPADPANQFATGKELTFLIELKNVSAEPIEVAGVRYSGSYGSASGRLNTSFFAPTYFSFAFQMAGGAAFPRPTTVFPGNSLVSSGASKHQLAPGKSLRLLLKPSELMKPFDHLLPKGEYTVRLTYSGPKKNPLRNKEEPNNTWTHQVVSNSVAFKIQADHESLSLPKLNWGPETKGLRAAIQVTRPTYVVESPHSQPGVPIKAALGVIFHVQNVSQQPIELVSETSRQDDHAHITDSKGEAVRASGVYYSGWPIDVRWRIEPGQTAKLPVTAPAISTIEKAGEYSLNYDIRIPGHTTFDANEKQVLPAPTDWQGTLRTGDVKIVLRERTPDDDDRAKPPTFSGRIQFESEKGEPVVKGSFTYRGQIKSKYHENRLIKAGPMTIPDCTSQPATITVVADGYEERRFSYVDLSATKVKILKLKPTAPARFRLVNAKNGNPVANAKIRRFNRNYAKTTSGPYPTKGIEGPVWATSDDNGNVVLLSLQAKDSDRPKLGDAMYYFYIEPASKQLAPTFVGPIKANQNLGEIQLGAFATVRGEVRGTQKQLDNFAAEWDQPFAQTNDNPEGTFVYAKSERLKTKRDGEKLTFELTGLRPGPLRIIANFGKRPHKVKHSYSRRDVGEGDLLFNFEISGDVDDIVIDAKGQKEELGPR